MLVVYTAGLVVMLLQLLLQQWSVQRFVRHATAVHEDDWMDLLAECTGRMGIERRVQLLRSREHNVPMTFGTWTPSIVIPAVAESWTDERRRAVLLHELAHVARFDCLTQATAAVACAMYWFHPAAWWVARRIRMERELACDDRVIAAGTEARDYAGHLLEIAYSLGSHRAPALAVSMARRSQLEGRMLAALDRARNRRVPGIRACLIGATIAGVLVCVVATARPTLVAAEIAEARAAAPATVEPVTEQDPALDPRLESVRGSVKELVRHVVRSTAAAVGITQSGLPGTWEIRPANVEGSVNLRLVESFNSSWGSTVSIDRLEGLTRAQLTGAGGPAQFRLRRDAGTFSFDGVLRNGVGAGTFTFAADPNFPAELAKRGFARPTAAEQYDLARSDVGFAFLDELNAQGYSKPTTSELVRAGQHGVHTTYLHDMGALGYRLGSLPALVTLRDHGVSPAYVRELADQGYKGLSADELRRARDHGISPEYVRAMRDAGYGSLSMDTLINARDHGVGAEYVRQLGDAGHRKVPLDELIRVRDHGVSPEYARDMAQLGYALPLNELVRARDHGVGVEFVRDMTGLGYKGLTMDSLVRVRDHGVTPQYARDLQSLGYDRLQLDDLITLRDHGVTADRIKSANARAGTRLPIDMLKSLAAGGWR
jgi:beta-lactamase regulating signal transducer with metallopeptidase domain